MGLHAIDTLSATKRLTAAGANDNLAEEIVSIFDEAAENTFATKEDLKQTETTLQAKIKETEQKKAGSALSPRAAANTRKPPIHW